MKEVGMITDEREAILYLANKKRAEEIKEQIQTLKDELKEQEQQEKGYSKETLDRLKEYFKSDK